eukprot:4724320-Amphidinium_carterae.1
MVCFPELGSFVACNGFLKARDGAHAIELANQSAYGLGGAVFTKACINMSACRLCAMMQSDPCCFPRVPILQ